MISTRKTGAGDMHREIEREMKQYAGTKCITNFIVAKLPDIDENSIQIINFTTFYLPFLNPKMNLREYRITSIQVLQCKWNPSKTALKIRGYETLYGLSESALACIVERVGPVVVGFDASGAGLQHYKYVPGRLN